MGDEISETKFPAEVFEEFRNRLDMETVILQNWIDEGKLHCDRPSAGCELEAWLTDDDGNPAPNNDELLSKLNNQLVVPELAKFNVELNSEPLTIEPGFLETMHSNLLVLWQSCERVASSQGRNMTMIGILPSVKQSDLCMENQSNMKRYLALNEQIFRLRNGAALELKIEGKESLQLEHFDVMLEAAATSFQIHYKVDIDKVVAAYNASRILSAPIVAMAANSPFLFGHDLWAESRIPLFEQAVRVGGSAYSNRVSFGIRHAGKSIMECFNVNRVRYPTLLPQLMDTPPEELAHLRMHNGTIWRWNRPLIGFSGSGKPHIRIEHRVPAAGPSIVDTVANAAFYFGALTALLDASEPIENTIPNRDAAHNFYQCAKHGLDAQVLWQTKQPIAVKELIIQELLPLAKKGLLSIGYGAVDADYWLDIIRQRVKFGQNGATWQRNWVSKYGRDFKQLVLSYHDNQVNNTPVHTWTL